MTKRERLKKFLANDSVDRVPLAFFHHFCSPDQYYRGLEDEAAFETNIDGHKRARDIYDPDVAKVMNESLLLLPLEGPAVESAADLSKIRPVSVDSRFFEKSMELTSRARAVYGPETPVYCTGFSPLLVLRMCLINNDVARIGSATGEARLLKYLVEEPEAIADALSAITERMCDLHHMLMTQCGCDGLYFSVNNQCSLIREDLFRSSIMPYEAAILAAANKDSSINMLHICGFAGKPNDIALFKGYDAAAYNWAVHTEGVSLSEGKKLFGHRPVCGGFGPTVNDVLYKGTREEVEAFTYSVLDDAGQIGVMLGADCTVPTDIDDRRFEWVREAATKYAAR